MADLYQSLGKQLDRQFQPHVPIMYLFNSKHETGQMMINDE